MSEDHPEEGPAYREGVNSDPEGARVQADMGDTLYDDSMYAEAEAAFREAVRLDPNFSPALLALGKAYFANQQYELAANTLGRMPLNDPNAREADFDRGLAYFYTGSYIKAEDAFAFVSKQLPLPEVLNNQGVARSRVAGLDQTCVWRFHRRVHGSPWCLTLLSEHAETNAVHAYGL